MARKKKILMYEMNCDKMLWAWDNKEIFEGVGYY